MSTKRRLNWCLGLCWAGASSSGGLGAFAQEVLPTVQRLAPFGVPTTPDLLAEVAPGAPRPNLPGSFRIMAALPPMLGPEARCLLAYDWHSKCLEIFPLAATSTSSFWGSLRQLLFLRRRPYGKPAAENASADLSQSFVPHAQFLHLSVEHQHTMKLGGSLHAFGAVSSPFVPLPGTLEKPPNGRAAIEIRT